jgi:hypothetical protein
MLCKEAYRKTSFHTNFRQRVFAWNVEYVCIVEIVSITLAACRETSFAFIIFLIMCEIGIKWRSSTHSNLYILLWVINKLVSKNLISKTLPWCSCLFICIGSFSSKSKWSRYQWRRYCHSLSISSSVLWNNRTVKTTQLKWNNCDVSSRSPR